MTDKYVLVPVEPTEEMLRAVSWQGCAATDYAHMLAAAPQVEQEPVAYAVFADNGNIRIWCADPVQAQTLREKYGYDLKPLYATPPAAPDVSGLVEALAIEFPRIDPASPERLDKVKHCCEQTLHLERERLHRTLAAYHAAQPTQGGDSDE